jgi:putative transposase
MEDFRRMTNECIRIGLEFERSSNGRTPSMKKLSLLAYGELRRYKWFSQYRLGAISKAAAILSSRRKSISRGFSTKVPHMSKVGLASCYGFKISNSSLTIHLTADRFESIPLNPHTMRILSDSSITVRSFTLTETSLSLCVAKDVQAINEIAGTIGIDRNLRNIASGNDKSVTYYNMTKAVDIAENTRSVVKSFKRNDARILKVLSSKYGGRRARRISQLIHNVAKEIIRQARIEHRAIIFEEIKGIRKLYRKQNRQGSRRRAIMNSWSFFEVKRQIEYKAAWEGIPVITLTRDETKGTTMDCPRCGERLQVPVRGDSDHNRQLWCDVCRRWRDRDLVAVLNISRRGWLRFDHSSTEGGAGEAVKGNPGYDGEPVILRVDASKLPEIWQMRAMDATEPKLRP